MGHVLLFHIFTADIYAQGLHIREAKPFSHQQLNDWEIITTDVTILIKYQIPDLFRIPFIALQLVLTFIWKGIRLSHLPISPFLRGVRQSPQWSRKRIEVIRVRASPDPLTTWFSTSLEGKDLRGIIAAATHICSLLRPHSVDLRGRDRALRVEMLQHMPNDLWQFGGVMEAY